MTASGILQLVLYLVVLLLLARPLGAYMARVFEGRGVALDRVLGWLERGLYRVCGIDPTAEMGWTAYAGAMLVFNLIGLLAVYALQRLQGVLPLNPQALGAVTPDSSFNTAVSFATNTNWQGYGGETTMSYLTQMLGLTVQNFVSAAAGMATLAALIRGFARRSAATIGNFWVDLTRTTLYVLLPLSFVLALVLVSQGVVQTFKPYATVAVVQPTEYDEPVTDQDGKPVLDEKGQPRTKQSRLTEQVIAIGPAASQVAIKQLGTNGGGFFNVNSAHPLENATPLSNFLELLSILLIPAALCYTFGAMVGDTRQGWAILSVMGVLFVAGVAITYWAEANGTSTMHALGLTGGNMEGKEVRFGIVASSLFAVVTTAASCGAVNAMHDSFTALGGMIPLINMQLGEIIIGGVGAGLYGMLLFVIEAIFVAGLMVGRTPEYVGKKIEAKEVKMTMLALLILPASMLGLTALAVSTQAGLAGILNPGPHGFTEVLYAYTSGTANNGSAFGGLTATSLFYTVTLGFAMLIGRFLMIVPMLAVAGSLAAKRSLPPSSGTFPTTGPLFVGLLIGVVLIMGGLTFFPALALGPIVDQLASSAGTLF